MSRKRPEPPDPNDWVDPRDVYDDQIPDDDVPDEIIHFSFVIVPGNDVNHASLVYWENGIEGTTTKWGLSLYYGYRYNGPDIPIGPKNASRILDNMLSVSKFEEHDWLADDYAYFE